MSYFVFDQPISNPGPLTEWLEQPSINSVWIPKDDLPEVFTPLVTNAKKLFDLKDVVGFEFWTHNQTRPDWHFDKDEYAYKQQRRLILPLCSMVYYAKVENLYGGELYFKDGTRILPKTNRQIVFGPALFHKVSAYHGTRVTMLLNPWATKPQAITEDKQLIQQLKGIPK